MSKLYEEGNLLFDFTAFTAVYRFDNSQTNPYGMKSVDFVAETENRLYFIEIKDYQHPKAPLKQRNDDKEMLINAAEGKGVFNIEMGVKIKDSILRRYTLGDKFTKEVIYLLLINQDELGEYERGLLKTRISDHVPSGLNSNIYKEFTRISFDLVNANQLKFHGIECTSK